MNRWLLLLVSTALALAAAEVVSRAVAPTEYMKPMPARTGDRELVHRRSAVPGLAYELRPGSSMRMDDGHLVRINAAGMRGPELAPGGAACTVVALGDSFTFGFAVSEEETWPAVVERRLRDAGGDVRVLNMAVTGYSARDEALVLREKALAYAPDVVVIGYVLNDPETLYPWAATPLYFRDPSWWQYSNLLRLAAQAPRALGIRAHGGSVVRYLHDADGEPWRSVAGAFADAAALARQHGFDVLVAIFPMPDGPDWNAYPFADVHAEVARLAVRNGFGALDLLDVWRRYPVLDVVLSPRDVHPTALGHRVTGEAIARRIVQRDLLPARCFDTP